MKQSATTTVFGEPSSYARHLAREAATKIVGLSMIALAAVLLLLRFHGLWVPCLVVLAASMFEAQRQRTFYEKAAIGTKSEVRVANELNRLNVTAVLHGMLLGAGGDCDHVVAGPILCAIETKTGRGPVRYEQGRLYVGQRHIPKDPVNQVRRQARALARLSGRSVTPIVCVVDQQTAPFYVEEVTVCSLRDLPSVLARCQTVFAPEAAYQFAKDVFSHQAQIAAQHHQRLQKSHA